MSEAISLGWNCEPAQMGVNSRLRKRKIDGYKTCPFDMCITNYDGIVKCIKDDFKYFVDPLYLKCIPADFSIGAIRKGEHLIQNTHYNFIFNHESPDHHDIWKIQEWSGGKNHFIDNDFEKFIERQDKRIANFRSYLEGTKKIIFMISGPNLDLTELIEVIETKYPNLVYDFYILESSTPKEHFTHYHNLMIAHTKTNDSL